MSITVVDQLSIEEAKQYNQRIRDMFADSLEKGVRCGCVSTRACENCGALLNNSPCFCVGIFTCPKCGYKHGQDIKVLMDKFTNYPVKITIPIEIEEDYQI